MTATRFLLIYNLDEERTWNSGQTFPAKLSVYGGSHPLYPASNLADITAGKFWHSAPDSPDSGTFRQDRKY